MCVLPAAARVPRQDGGAGLADARRSVGDRDSLHESTDAFRRLADADRLLHRHVGIGRVAHGADRDKPERRERLWHNVRRVKLARLFEIVAGSVKRLSALYAKFRETDESRYFEPGPKDETENLVRIGDLTAGLSICEDLWNDEKLIARSIQAFEAMGMAWHAAETQKVLPV